MPADVPWWVVVILVPASGALWVWFQKEFWPWLRTLWNADAKAKREAEKQAAAGREERFLAAYEQSAKALESLAKSSAESAQALQVATQTRVLDNLTLQRVERRLDAIEDRVGTAPPVVQAKARGT